MDSEVDRIILSRKSVRSYTNKEVNTELVRHILTMASHSPSSSNTQPWKVYVLQGPLKDRFSQEVIKEFNNETREQKKIKQLSNFYSPRKWFSPYIERKIEIGERMYDSLEIDYEDSDKRRKHYQQNFMFFGAPVGLIFTIDSRLEKGSFIDYGIFLQSIMLSSQSHGLSTCSIGFFSEYPDSIRHALQLSPQEIIVCGMSIGYEDVQSKINHFERSRSSVDSFTTFLS
jgi:nitroreductase